MKFSEVGNKLYIEDAEIMFRNFSGREQTSQSTGRVVNNEGNRNVSVLIPEDIAEEMAEAGWNIKIRPPKDEGDEPSHYMKVNISYRYQEPDIRTYVNRVETHVHEDTIGLLDDASIVSADVCVSKPKEVGRNGYLQELRLVIEPRPFDEKYADMMHPEE